MRGLVGKAAFVSGAGSGIGFATAKRLAEEGCRVTAGIYEEGQRASLHGVSTVLLDVSRELDWDRAIDGTLQSHGGLDILVNCAGIASWGTVEETTPELWQSILSVNLTGTALGCRKAIPALRRRAGGAIVNVASISAIRGNTAFAAYSASKAGIYGLTMQMAIDYAPNNIRVNCVCPGTIDTPMVDVRSKTPDFVAALTAKHPMGRLGLPHEVASVIAFLASDDASYITGLAIPVDGGRSVR
jgi:NAD(P)-dependent dehydrogenase (short-subunit alcohol dehydrogenase family)